MTFRSSHALFALLSFVSVPATAAPQGSATYLGQPVPGSEPAPFAPGLVSAGLYERDIAVTPDGKEVYFSVVGGQYRFTSIAVVRENAGRWTEPEVVAFSGDPTVMDIEPFLSRASRWSSPRSCGCTVTGRTGIGPRRASSTWPTTSSGAVAEPTPPASAR